MFWQCVLSFAFYFTVVRCICFPEVDISRAFFLWIKLNVIVYWIEFYWVRMCLKLWVLNIQVPYFLCRHFFFASIITLYLDYTCKTDKKIAINIIKYDKKFKLIKVYHIFLLFIYLWILNFVWKLSHGILYGNKHILNYLHCFKFKCINLP